MSAASKQLLELAEDLKAAAGAIFPAAGQVVHQVAQQAEVGVRAIDGSPESVVTSYPGVTSAVIHGTENAGVSQQTTPLQAMASVDTAQMADDLASGVLDAGVSLIMGAHR